MRHNIILYITLLLLLHGCKENHSRWSEKKTLFIKNNMQFVYSQIISDMSHRSQKYQLNAIEDRAAYGITLFLVQHDRIVDSLIVDRFSINLSHFDLLESKKYIYVEFNMKGGMCTTFSKQAIIQVKKGKILVPIVLPKEYTAACSVGAISDKPEIDSMYSSTDINLSLLDSKSICKIGTKNYSKTYNYKTKKYIINKKNSSKTLRFDIKTNAFCDSISYLNLKYLNSDADDEPKALTGYYPVRQMINKNEMYIFMGREWYHFRKGKLCPISTGCPL